MTGQDGSWVTLTEGLGYEAIFTEGSSADLVQSSCSKIDLDSMLNSDFRLVRA